MRFGNLLMAAVLLSLLIITPLPRSSAESATSRYFPETKRTVKDEFLAYWQANGGLAQQGYPISEEMQERSDANGKTYKVQYFERAVFEHHPQNKPPHNVLLQLLGVFRYKQKYPNGAPGQKANGDPGTVLFKETGKRVGGSFLAYWRKYGSVAQQGYPISDEFQERSDLDGKVYTVQYFERAVFEWHPENKPPYNVLLSQLGTFRYRQKYPHSAPPAPQPVQPTQTPPPPQPQAPLRDWTTPVNLSDDALYDNNAAVAASPLNGAVTIGWEQRDEERGTTNFVKAAVNSALDGPFRLFTLRSNGFKLSGGVRAKHDPHGRTHLVWWEQPDDVLCNYYARIERDGNVSIMERVPNTCGRHMKNTAVAIGPDLTVHMLFGNNYQTLYYYQRADNGNWNVAAEHVPNAGEPITPAIAVNSQGVVMGAFRAKGHGSGSDIYAGVRSPDGGWAIENLSATCCEGCPNGSVAYMPALASDPSGSGGFRLTWSDEQCDPRAEPRTLDLYYREWLPGRGWHVPMTRIVRDPGETYGSAIIVDNTGRSHIVYESDIGARGYFRVFYISGSGTSFTEPVVPFAEWGKSMAFQKAPALDYARGYLHVVFNGELGGNKEVFYANKQVTP